MAVFEPPACQGPFIMLECRGSQMTSGDIARALCRCFLGSESVVDFKCKRHTASRDPGGLW